MIIDMKLYALSRLENMGKFYDAGSPKCFTYYPRLKDQYLICYPARALILQFAHSIWH